MNDYQTALKIIDSQKGDGKKIVMADENLGRALHDLKQAKDNSKAWADVAGGIREAIVSELPEGESYEILEEESGAMLGSVTEVLSKRFDMAMFKADHPGIDLDKYYVASVSRQVRTK